MTQQYNSYGVNWTAAEEKLVREAGAAFREIATTYRDRKFYGVCFEADLVYTAVQAHANTNEGLREYAKQIITKFNKSEEVTIEQQMERSRWDVGGWRDFQIFGTPDFSEITAAFQQLSQQVDGYEAEMLMKGDMMDMACRAVVRMERAGVFDALYRTPDFRVMCIYREPAIASDEESAQRLSRIRQSFGNA